MNKIIVGTGIVAVLLTAFSTVALAATKYGAQFPRATLVSVVEDGKEQWPVQKTVDGAVTCYTFKTSISCVK